MLTKQFDPDDVFFRKYIADENENERDEKLSLQNLTNDTNMNTT